MTIVVVEIIQQKQWETASLTVRMFINMLTKRTDELDESQG